MSYKVKKHDPGAVALMCALEARVIASDRFLEGVQGP